MYTLIICFLIVPTDLSNICQYFFKHSNQFYKKAVGSISPLWLLPHLRALAPWPAARGSLWAVSGLVLLLRSLRFPSLGFLKQAWFENHAFWVLGQSENVFMLITPWLVNSVTWNRVLFPSTRILKALFTVFDNLSFSFPQLYEGLVDPIVGYFKCTM